MEHSKKKIVYVGRNEITSTIVAGDKMNVFDVFYVKFNSITSEFEDEFTEMVTNFQKLGRAPLVLKVDEHQYRIQRTNSSQSVCVWELILHKYMSCRYDLWKEIETEIKFNPVEVFVA